MILDKYSFTILIIILNFSFALSQSTNKSIFPTDYQEEIELVNIYVTVTDKKNNFITNLKENDFIIKEDGVEQIITNFSIENPPIAMFLLIDASGSMQEQIERNLTKFDIAKNAALTFIKKLRPIDTCGIITIEDYAYESCEPTSSINILKKELLFMESKQRNTALYDAIYYASEFLKDNKMERKILVIFSDGIDTSSTVTYNEALSKAISTDVAIFAFLTANLTKRDGISGYATLEAIAKYTGGKIIIPSNLNEIENKLNELEKELFTAYSIAYKPSSIKENKKKFRNITVEVKQNYLNLRYRKGYIR